MQTSASSDVITDPLDQATHEFIQNPYPTYKMLRENAPVVWSPARQYWLISRYEDVRMILNDRRFTKLCPSKLKRLFPNVGIVSSLESAFKSVVERGPSECKWISRRDPPEHTRFRTASSPSFLPGQIKLLEPFVREACKQKIDAFADRGGCDLVEDYAKDLPYEVIAHMIGIPLDDQSKVRSWVEIIGRCFEVSPSEEDLQEAAHAAGSYTEYMKALFSERKSTPLHDLVSEYGRPESGMSADEAIANLVLFTVAGFETTSPLISSGLYALLKHADQLELLRKQPDLITAVVEEVLRLEAPIPVTKYHVSESAELGGNTLRAGEKIRLLIGSANRDPEVFENPDVFDINRQNKKHLSFGSGIHYCLGGSLARLEGQISISMVLERFPNLRLSGDTVEYRSVMPRSIVSLPVEF